MPCSNRKVPDEETKLFTLQQFELKQVLKTRHLPTADSLTVADCKPRFDMRKNILHQGRDTLTLGTLLKFRMRFGCIFKRGTYLWTFRNFLKIVLQDITQYIMFNTHKSSQLQILVFLFCGNGFQQEWSCEILFNGLFTVQLKINKKNKTTTTLLH